MASKRQHEEKASVLTVRTAVAGVLVDESFSIPTEEIKKCLSIAQSLMKYFNCDQAMPTCEAFCSWLVDALEEIVRKSKKQSGVINADKLWNNYHRLTTSQVFKTNWEEFLGICDVDKEPMIYQHITNETFTKLIEQSVQSKDIVSEQNDEQNNDEEPSLAYEEENAVNYVGGFVIHALAQKKLSQSCSEILKEFINTDEVDKENIPEHEEWINDVDRGGLIRITAAAFQIFYAIETCVRRHFTIANSVDMDENFYSHLIKCILNDDNVLFYWCMAGLDESDEDNQKCLEMIVKKWVSIRRHSFADNIMEMYKQKEKKGTEKSKSLRSQVS